MHVLLNSRVKYLEKSRGIRLGKLKFIIYPLLILIPLSISFLIYHYAIADSFNRQFNQIVKPYIFDIGKWEVVTLTSEIDTFFNHETDVSVEDTSVVKAYFTNLERIRRLEYEIAAINSGTWQGDLAALEDELDEMRNHLKRKRSDHDTRLKLSRALWSTGEIKEAMKNYGTLIKSGAKMGEIYEDLQQYLTTHPKDSDLLRTLGDAYMKDGDLDRALEIYNEAMNTL